MTERRWINIQIEDEVLCEQVHRDGHYLHKTLLDILDACSDAFDRDEIVAPEDEVVRALCEQWGYGAVMDSVARQWARKSWAAGGDDAACVPGPHRGLIRQALAALEAVGDREY